MEEQKGDEEIIGFSFAEKPTLKPENQTIRTIPVVSAQEMYEACTAAFSEAGIVVLAAAVADYRRHAHALV